MKDLIRAATDLATAVAELRFAPPVSYVYNPLIYARHNHELYLTRYAAAPKEVLLVGMNPGPWGMVQTGIPFGDVGMVRDWLKLDGTITPPATAHPRRPVLGLACPRREVSGARLWGAARQHCGTPERFFARFFVANYCPLAFVETSGKNRTPDNLPAAEQTALFALCDAHLRQMVTALKPRIVVGVGTFAEQRARCALAELSAPPRIGRILHPSPASPLANRGWAEAAHAQLRELGVCDGHPLTATGT